jgi:hypothetical protein
VDVGARLEVEVTGAAAGEALVTSVIVGVLVLVGAVTVGRCEAVRACESSSSVAK